MGNVSELNYPLAKLKNVIKKWLYIENDTVIDIIVAVYIANRLQADPLWLLIIAPPSTTKTELLRGFADHKNTYFISSLTPSTLVSGMKPTDTGKELSLLPELNNKLVILKDFTSVLSMRSENQQEILAQLREVYDGKYSKVFGTGKAFHWKGRFGLIGASTPVYDAHYGVISSMGERFLLYRTDNSNSSAMGIQAQRIVGKEDKMRAEIRQALHKFIDQFEEISSANFEKDNQVNHMIVSLANFVAYCRCPVRRDFRNRQQPITHIPTPEGPARLVKQFMQIGIGLTYAHQKQIIDKEIYQTIKKIGKDLVPTQRLRILNHLWNERAVKSSEVWLKTKEISDVVNLPVATVRLSLEDLMVINVLKRDIVGEKEKSPYVWQISQQLCEWIDHAEIFSDSELKAS
jgi:hypothetical protein